MSCFVLFSSMHDISLLEIQFGLSKALDATRFPGVRKMDDSFMDWVWYVQKRGTVAWMLLWVLYGVLLLD